MGFALRSAGRPLAAIAAAVLLALHAGGAGAQHRPVPSIERNDPRFDRLVPPGASIEKVADGFGWVEGPVWDRRSGALYFSDVQRNAVHRWREGEGARLHLKPSGYSGTLPFEGREPGANGLALDPRGRLLLAEHGDRRIARLEEDGRQTKLVDRWKGKRLNSPNDLVLRANGDVVFTDPPFGLPGTFHDPAREIPFTGVYRLSADGALTLLTRSLDFANGLAFSLDGRFLYVSSAEPRRPRWMRFDVRADGTLGEARVFYDGTRWARRWKGSADGMKVDREGNLFAAGPGGIYVFAPDGAHLGSILTGVATSNCAFGGDGTHLYITASTAVYRVRLAARGARP